MKSLIILVFIKMILFGLAGVFNGVMDKLDFHYGSSIFPIGEKKFLWLGEQFWNPELSWLNKYKDFTVSDKGAISILPRTC